MVRLTAGWDSGHSLQIGPHSACRAVARMAPGTP